MDSDEELVRKILMSLRKVQWESCADNPWSKKPEFECIKPDVFPLGKGVYSFNNCDKPETYYLGKAEIGCRNRLDKKLKADWNETRVTKEFRDGVWHHEYEYLTDYQLYNSRICCRAVENDDFSTRDLESVLLAAHYVLFGKIPKTNRTGVPGLSRNETLHDDLREIGQLMFSNVCDAPPDKSDNSLWEQFRDLLYKKLKNKVRNRILSTVWGLIKGLAIAIFKKIMAILAWVLSILKATGAAISAAAVWSFPWNLIILAIGILLFIILRCGGCLYHKSDLPELKTLTISNDSITFDSTRSASDTLLLTEEEDISDLNSNENSLSFEQSTPTATFDKGHSSFASIDKTIVEEILAFVSNNPNAKIAVIGYSSSEGDASFNNWLSEKRAMVFKKYLIRKGMNEGQIEAVGRGNENPIAPNDTDEGKSKNRRVEIKVLQ